LRDNLHGAVEEFDDVGNVEIVLIETAEEENFIFLEGPPMVAPPCCWRLCGLKVIMGSAAPNPLSRM
jgi:hypothetical protein